MKNIKKAIIFSMSLATIIALFIVFFSNSSRQENLDNWIYDYVNYTNLHEYSKGESQKIAIIDSGVSEGLLSNENSSFSLVSDNAHDINGHGTMMYSIIKVMKKKS